MGPWGVWTPHTPNPWVNGVYIFFVADYFKCGKVEVESSHRTTFLFERNQTLRWISARTSIHQFRCWRTTGDRMSVCLLFCLEISLWDEWPTSVSKPLLIHRQGSQNDSPRPRKGTPRLKDTLRHPPLRICQCQIERTPSMYLLLSIQTQTY